MSSSAKAVLRTRTARLILAAVGLCLMDYVFLWPVLSALHLVLGATPPGPTAEQAWPAQPASALTDERHISVTVEDHKLTVIYHLKLAEDSVLVRRLIAADAKDRASDFVDELLGYVGLLQWKHPGWTPTEDYFDPPALKAPEVRLPAENGMVDISVESEPYALYVQRLEILLAKPDSDHLFKNDDVTLNIPSGRVFLDLPDGENLHAIVNQNGNISVIDRNQLTNRYPRLTLDSTEQRSMLRSFWANTHIMVPWVHEALWKFVVTLLPLILLFAFVSRHEKLIPQPAWDICRPLLCAFLVLGVTDLAFSVAWDWPVIWYHTYLFAMTGLLVVWLPAIHGLWRRGLTALMRSSIRRWLWIGAFGLLWCCAATSGGLLWSKTHDVEQFDLSEIIALPCLSLATFFLAAIFVDAALPGFSGPAVALITFVFSTILVAVTGLGDWLLTPETQRLNFPGRSTAVLMSALLLIGLFGVIIAWMRAVVADAGRMRSRTLEALVLFVLVVATIPWLIFQAVGRQPESPGIWAVFELLDRLSAIEYLVATACVFFIIYKLDELPLNRTNLGLKRSIITLYAILTFYWFDDQWLYIPVQIVSGAILLLWFALPGSNLQKWPAACNQPPLPLNDGLGDHLDVDGMRWSSGLGGAAYGAVAGLPWVLLSMRQLDEYSWSTTGTYPLLDLMGTNLWIALQWPLYGFFFAYAYPMLRGTTASSKALTLTIVVVAPQSLSKLLSWQHTALQQVGIFALQTLAFSLLLAGLLEVSKRRREEGFAWRDLPKVYARSSLVTWATSLTVAIVAAIAGALTTGVTGLVADALSQQFHLPGGP
jgi:hypothetical protein